MAKKKQEIAKKKKHADFVKLVAKKDTFGKLYKLIKELSKLYKY